jgi:hypothetical protein
MKTALIWASAVGTTLLATATIAMAACPFC